MKLLTIQSKFINLCFISKRLMLHQKFSQDLATYFFQQKIDSCEIKSFKLFKKF